jgi:hypothetical protein
MQRHVPGPRSGIEVASRYAAGSAGPGHARRAHPTGVLAVLVLAFLLAAVPTAALAKGATGATISGGGPGGLPRGPITLKGDGEPGSGTGLANLAEEAGVWAVLFEDGAPGALDSAPAPATQRGPRYTITWVFPNGAGANDKVRQSVWPYAAGGPLTYMAPGQPVLETTTSGGWFRAGDNLRRTLIGLGLPNRPALTAPQAPTAAAPATPAAPAANPAAPAPAAPAPAAPDRAADPAPSTSAPVVWPWVAAGIGLLGVVAALAVARRRSAGGAGAS